jgi:cytochrome bd ubiquinol oxidase subunit II
MLDYEFLRLSWWLLMGILFIGFAITDGFDLGVASLLNFIAKTDSEKRIVINTVGPFWEGNQVWLLLAGGAIFAAFPYVYAVSFSGFYLAMMLLLFALILRPVAFKYRSKSEKKGWRDTWDFMHFLSGFLPALLSGVAVGNVIQGISYEFDKATFSVVVYTTFLELLNPYAILIGLISVTMLFMHGSIYVCIKTEDPIQSRTHSLARFFGILFLLLYLVASFWTFKYLNGYKIVSPIILKGASNPLLKQVIQLKGAWGDNFRTMLWVWLAPIFTVLGAIFAIFFVNLKKYSSAFISSAISIFGTVSTVGLGLFPFILPNSLNPSQSLTLWDSSSSQKTLEVMFFSALIFVPIVLIYTSWVYRVLRGKITHKTLTEEN